MENDELRLTQDTWIKIWQIYISWFTWHFGIHVLALGWTFSKVVENGGKYVPYLGAIAAFMIALNGFGLFAAICMCMFDIQVKRRVAKLQHSVKEQLVFGGAITWGARWATIGATGLTLLAWLSAPWWGYH